MTRPLAAVSISLTTFSMSFFLPEETMAIPPFMEKATGQCYCNKISGVDYALYFNFHGNSADK